MSQEKLGIIYEMVANDEIITDKSLKEKGLTDDEIMFLFEDDRLYYLGENRYFITYTSDLIDYAKYLISKRNKTQDEVLLARKLAEKSTLFEPNDFEALSLYFYNVINRAPTKIQVDRAIKVLDEMKNISNDEELQDVNLYYFLLNHLTNLPEENVKEAMFIKLDDIYLKNDDNRYESINYRNHVRKNAYSQKYSQALTEIRKVIYQNKNSLIYDKILEKLLIENIRRKRQFTLQALEYAKNDKIEDLVHIYNEENERRFITNHEFYNLKLGLKYLDLVKYERIPKIKNVKTKTVYEAIDNNDFEKAMEETINNGTIGDLDVKETVIYVLIEKIINKINNIKNERKLKLKMPN